MSLPQTDVIIPAFNAAQTIGAAVASVLAQTAPDLRIFVIDDGSTDGTAAVVKTLAGQDSRVTLVSRPNGGISSALNAGLELSTAPFVARLDADDLSAPDRHELQLRHFAKNPAVVAVSGAHREIRADGTETGRTHSPKPPEDIDPFWAPAKEPQLTQPFFMARREALETVGGFRPLSVSEDSDLYWRLMEKGKLDNVTAVLGSYRMHAGSISSGSILNGRIMALSSQLAALSAQRRRGGRPDLVFLAGQTATWRAAEELGAMLAIVSRDFGLTAEEVNWLQVATAGKLMELAGYRPYELQTSDCRFIAHALAQDAHLPEGNRAELAKMQAATAARLLRLGRARDAVKVVPLALFPQAAARAAVNRTYWKKHLG